MALRVDIHLLFLFFCLIDSGRGAARAEDAQETPTQSHISPSILACEEKARYLCAYKGFLHVRIGDFCMYKFEGFTCTVWRFYMSDLEI